MHFKLPGRVTAGIQSQSSTFCLVPRSFWHFPSEISAAVALTSAAGTSRLVVKEAERWRTSVTRCSFLSVKRSSSTGAGFHSLHTCGRLNLSPDVRQDGTFMLFISLAESKSPRAPKGHQKMLSNVPDTDRWCWHRLVHSRSSRNQCDGVFPGAPHLLYVCFRGSCSPTPTSAAHGVEKCGESLFPHRRSQQAHSHSVGG